MRNKSILRITTMMIAVVMVFAVANAQSTNKRFEKQDDRKDIIQSQYNLNDDRADFNRLSKLVEKWKKARKFESDRVVNKIEKRINREIKNDIAESSRQIKQFACEVERSKDELRFDNNGKYFSQKVTFNPKSKGYKSKVVKFRKDHKDELRDLQDDIRDLKSARRILAQKQDIARSIKQVQQKESIKHSRTNKLQKRQLNLMKNYLSLEKKEIKLALGELQEDRREFCEDFHGNKRHGF